MSNLLAQTRAATQPSADVAGLIVLLWTVASIVGLLVVRVHQPSSIVGRARLGRRTATGPILAIFLAGLAAWLIVPTVYAGLVLSRSGATTQTDPRDAFTPADLIWSAFLSQGVALGILVAGDWILRRNTLRRLGVDSARLPGGLGLGMLSLLLAMPLVLWANVGTQWLWHLLDYRHEGAHPMLRTIQSVKAEPHLLVMLLISVTVTAPLFEELLFRGHLQTLLRRGLGRPWLAVVLASAGFALVHQAWMAPPIFVLSLAIGYVYERTGNLWACVIMHALFNGSSTLFYVLAQR